MVENCSFLDLFVMFRLSPNEPPSQEKLERKLLNAKFVFEFFKVQLSHSSFLY